MYLNKIRLGFIAALIMPLAFITCKKNETQDGYIGESIRYKNKIIFLKTGQDQKIGEMTYDGTTGPIKVKLLEIRKMDGSPAPEMKKEVDAVEWIQEYTGQETSLEEVNAKRKIVKRPVFEISEPDGRFIFRKESFDMDTATYLIDIEISNSAGSRTIKNAAEIHITKGPEFEIRDQGSWIVCADYDDDCYAYFDSLNAYISKFERVGDADGKIIMKWYGPDGQVLNPKTFPPGSQAKGKNMKYYSLKETMFDDRIEYDAILPFNVGFRQFEWWVPGSGYGKSSYWDTFTYTQWAIFRPGTWEINWQLEYL